MMDELNVKENLRWRIEDIHGKTTCNVAVNREEVGDFKTKTGVRQGFPLSPSFSMWTL